MKKNKKFAFTLAETLITLSIIGVIAAITLSNLIQVHQEKELATRTKKLYSDISNALVLAQKDFDMIGDNSALFNTTYNSYEVAEELGKYFNGSKVCKNKNAKGCFQFYYDVKYATKQLDDNSKGKVQYDASPKIILSNGAIIGISTAKSQNCTRTVTSVQTDKYGRPIKNSDGSEKTIVWTSYSCGYLNVDVNGFKKPNQYGRDAYQFPVYKDKLMLQFSNSLGGKSLRNIFSDNGKLEYENYTKGESY